MTSAFRRKFSVRSCVNPSETRNAVVFADHSNNRNITILKWYFMIYIVYNVYTSETLDSACIGEIRLNNVMTSLRDPHRISMSIFYIVKTLFCWT